MLFFAAARHSRIEWIQHKVPQGGGSMEGFSVDGRNGKLIQSVAEMIVRFHGDVFPKFTEWEQRLKADPEILDTFEREVQQEFSHGAGLVVAGLIAVVMQTKEFAVAAERVRQNYSVTLAVPNQT